MEPERYTLRPMSADDVEAMRAWHYPAPYEVYDGESDPGDIELMLADIGSKDRWFAVVDPQSDDLVGFFEFKPVDGERELEIGLGLRPDLTGIGLGAAFVEAGLVFARARWAPETFVLDVLPWNERAIKAYERAGFVRGEGHLRRFEGGVERRFLRMSRRA